jgi:putative DNA primase/helicase
LAKDRLVWVDVWKCWYKFDEGRWSKATQREINRFATQVVKRMLVGASVEDDPDEQKLLAKHAIRCQSNAAQNGMIEQAKSMLAIDPGKFDQADEFLNLVNGTLDLASGVLRPHFPNDFITKRADYDFKADAKPGRFIKFLFEILDGDSERIGLWQRIFGACLMGQRGFDRFIVLYGTGANGKSVLMNVLRRMLGEYAVTAKASVFTSEKDDPQGFGLHPLRGARVVTASEANEGRRLNLALVKEITGGEPFRSAPKYGHSTESFPVWHFFLSTNHKPKIFGQDEGTWRRILYLKFGYTVPKNQRRPLDEFINYLCEELPGILNWAKVGLDDYRKNGLAVPNSVEKENEAYRQEQDVFGEWLEKKCVIGSGHFSPIKDLYSDYTTFAEDQGDIPVTKHRLGSGLDQIELESVKSNGIRGRRVCLVTSCSHEQYDANRPLSPVARVGSIPEMGNSSYTQPREDGFPDRTDEVTLSTLAFPKPESPTTISEVLQ